MALLLAPVSLGVVLGVEVPASDIVLAVGALWSLNYLPYARQFIVLLAPMYWGLLVLLIATLAYSPPGSLRGFGSWLFVFRGFAALLIGASLAARGVRVTSVIRVMAVVGAVVATMVVVQLVLTGERHLDYGPLDVVGKTGLFLNGELLGRPLWGRYGVNSLAGFYSVVFGICLAHVSCLLTDRSVSRHGEFLLVAAGLAASGWLVVTSGSRQALGVLVLLVVLAAAMKVLPGLVARSRGRSVRRFVMITAGVAIGSLAFLAPGNPVQSSLSATLDQFGGGGFGEISTGRDVFFARAFRELQERPITGTGFYGSQLSGVDDQLNAHNVVFGALFRMGVIGAALLVVALVRVLRPAASRVWSGLAHGTQEPWQVIMDGTLLCAFVVLGAVADVMPLTPVIVPPLLVFSVRQVSGAMEATVSTTDRAATQSV